MDNMDSMIDMYLFEANTLLEQLDEILLLCEKQSAFDSDSINEIFRIMHTIKGSSAMMQYGSLMTISHKIEDLFYIVRENGIKEENNNKLFDLLFKSGDFLKSEIGKLSNNEPLTSNIGNFEQEINDFIKIISTTEKNVELSSEKCENIIEKDYDIITESLYENLTDDQTTYTIKVFFEVNCEMENLRAFMLITQLTEVCGEISYSPSDVQTNPKAIEQIEHDGFIITFADKEAADKGLKVVENFVYIRDYTIINIDNQHETHKVEEISEIETSKITESKDISTQTIQDNSQAHASSKQSLINVNLTKLDKLMDLVGEIVIYESMVTSVDLVQKMDVDSFEKASRELRKLTNELQQIVMSIRLVPISGVFQKMNRIVRDMGKKLNKEADLVLIGEETEVDKTIIDSISDPIMHLVRNAMDHGIETVNERIEAGKSRKGTITLSAQNTGGEILITIQDDGQGINPPSILKKAKENGLLHKPESEYSAREVYSLLLMPGFSTNEAVTEFSGRGVGMDVVKKNIEKVGGEVSIDSELGRGSIMVLKIPLTLAIVNGMEVTVADSLFTIPINNIKKSLKPTKEEIVYDSEMREMIIVRDEYYPIVRLHELFNIETEIKDITQGILIQVETNDKPYCIFADYLLGEQQVVVKSLPIYLNKYNVKECGITGCAILGDGNISLILDVANLSKNM